MLASSTVPPSSASTAVISPAGSACTMLPTVVPRFLITGCATSASACPTSGCACLTAGSASTWACLARAPITTWPPATLT